MDFGLEALLVAIVFLLPGFLTTRLVNARTAARPPRLTPFHETAESLLRSAYIHLCLSTPVVMFLLLLSPIVSPLLPKPLDTAAVVAMITTNAITSAAISILWLAAAFVLAALFGIWTDPLDWCVKVLNRRVDTTSEDPFHLLTEEVKERRRGGATGAQLWVQATTTKDHVFQGQFLYVGYPESDMPRELLLANVFHFQSMPGQSVPMKSGPDDFAYLPMESCHSLEFRIFDPTGK